MDLQQCYETLELNPASSLQDVRQAYKDLVNIWHPDRVANNPRLKQKAEEKLKEINIAYEALLSHLSSRPKGDIPVEKAPRTQQPQEDTTFQESRPERAQRESRETDVRSGAGMVSTLWSFLSDLLRGFSEGQPSPQTGARPQPYSENPGQQPARRGGVGRGMGNAMGRGRGKGMGRGKGGMGRGGSGRGGRG